MKLYYIIQTLLLYLPFFSSNFHLWMWMCSFSCHSTVCSCVWLSFQWEWTMPSRRHCVTVWGTSVHHNSLSYHKGVALNTYWWQFSVYFLFVLPFRPMDSNALRMGIMHIGIYSVWRFVTDECSKKNKNVDGILKYELVDDERLSNDERRSVCVLSQAKRRQSNNTHCWGRQQEKKHHLRLQSVVSINNSADANEWNS